ncbi:MAG: InlB B-repeat-containing protein [Bacilli bacterium]|nr:InlB B-repeat-containing protein [Bacilli bacterium]
MFKKIAFKKVLTVCLLLLYASAIIIISRIDKVAADIKVFQLVNAKIAEKSEKAQVDVKFNEKTVNTNFTFHQVNDYIIYNLTFKNNDKKDYIIKEIYDDNENPYVIYSYDQFKDKKIKAGGTITIPVKITYDSEVNDLDKRHISDSVKFSFNIMDKEGNMVIANSPTNSRLVQNIIGWAILAIVVLIVVIILIVRNKKKNKAIPSMLVLSLFLIPIITHAVDSSYDLTLKANIKLHDKLAMTVVQDGKEEVIAVPFGETPEIPEEPVKKGYEFVGWYADDEEYDFDSEVSEDIELTAKYKINNYSISYNLDEGTVAKANPTNYNVESKSITLNNPTKEGYSFSGWTGSNGKAYQTRVTIDTGTVGDLTFTANFSPRTDIPYTVVHKYKNYNGDGYDDVYVEKLVGSTDSIVQPAPRPIDGYVNPSLKNLKITLDGKASIEYIYERAFYTLSYNSDVISNRAPGLYKYGTTVAVSAIDKVGYTFNKWGINVESVPAFIDMDGNNSITVGDIVTIGSEWFYVALPVENGEVKLLPKYNVDKDGRQNIDAKKTTFSNTNYWDYGNPNAYSSPIYAYTTETDRYGYNLNLLYSTITKYKDYLNSISKITIKEARPMKFNEAISMKQTYGFCPVTDDSQSFWTGSVFNRSHAYAVRINCSTSYYNAKTSLYGIRPLIIINETDISILNETSSVSSFTMNGNVNLVPSYKPNKNTPYSVVHKKQDMDDETVYVIADREDKTGITGDVIRPSVKNNYGSNYTIPSSQTVSIAADGSTVVEYIYNYKYYNITLNPNGGTVNNESIKVTKGSAVSLSTPILVGFTFVGWYTEAEGGTLVVGPDESFTPTSSQTLYAHWEKAPATVSIYAVDTDGDRVLSSGDKVVIGDDVFYYVSKDGNTNNIKLIAKYVLDYNDRQTANKDDFYTTAFASARYWESGYTSDEDYSFSTDEDGEYMIYRTNKNQDISENRLTNHVNNYAEYLRITYNINLIDARIPYYYETYAMMTMEHDYHDYTTQSHWLGSIDCLENNCQVYYYGPDDIYMDLLSPWNANTAGIRPLVIIPEEIVSIPWGSTEDAGSEVTIGNDIFYIVGKDYNGNIKLLPKYNLDSNYRQSEANAVTLQFSTTNYWATTGSSNAEVPETACYDAYCEKTEYFRYVYRDIENNDVSDNNLTIYVNNYASYLKTTYNLDVIDARLMSYGEAILLGCNYESGSCPSYITSHSFWLGTMFSERGIWHVNQPKVSLITGGNTYQNIMSDHYDDLEVINYLNLGVRPLIIVPPSAIQNH